MYTIEYYPTFEKVLIGFGMEPPPAFGIIPENLEGAGSVVVENIFLRSVVVSGIQQQ